jgi:hypothetical protein
MADPSQQQPREFSLIRGGLFYRFERRFGLVRAVPPDPGIRMWGGVIVTFLPLVALAAVQGVLYGHRVTLPLLYDITAYTRFLFAVPLLVAAERSIDGRLADAVRQFRTTELAIGPARPGLEAAIAKLERRRDSLVPETILLLGAFVMGWFSTRALGPPVPSWRMISPGDLSTLTLAGRWLDFVSLPLFNFLVFRWLWRIALWALFLGRVSRLDLRLVPTHPDGAAGLGFLGEIHMVFGAFLVPVSATMAARGVEWIQYGGGKLTSFQNAAIAYIVLALLLALGPLLVFMPKLMAAKRNGLLEYGRFAQQYTGLFDRKWLREPPDENPLGSSDIQSLADLGNSYNVIRSMRIVPPSAASLVIVLMAAALPMVPFLAFIMPVDELLKLIVQLVAR